MKSKILFTLVASFLMLPIVNISNTYAIEAHNDHVMHDESSHHSDGDVIDVGNKICPVSGEKIGSHGKAYKVEHDGKSYNLCCKMCAKDFKKDPEKYIAKLKEMKTSGESAAKMNHHEGSHDDHGDHDHH